MGNLARKHILVIDDSADNQALLNLLIGSRGYTVHCASNGEEALSLLNDCHQLPDLILLDAQMPVMDGYEFRIKQKLNNRLKDIPVVVMTGDDDILMNEKMDFPEGILLKPLCVDSVMEIISHLITAATPLPQYRTPDLGVARFYNNLLK